MLRGRMLSIIDAQFRSCDEVYFAVMGSETLLTNINIIKELILRHLP